MDFVTQLVTEDLQHRLAIISRKFDKALIIAPDVAHLPKSLSSASDSIDFIHAATLVAMATTHLADPENLKLKDNNYDLIISLFDIGFTNNVPGFLSRILHHLAPDGLFLAAFVGGVSLSELRAAWLEADAQHLGGAIARIAPFVDMKDAGSLLQRAGFALPVTDIETFPVRYVSPMDLMGELKQLSASNPLYCRSAPLVTPAHLASACEAYQNSFSDPDGRVRATLEIIWMSGWAPHENQQKPLKPGSAQISLTRVLGKDKE